MKKEITFKNFVLPLFEGFYNSIWDTSHTDDEVDLSYRFIDEVSDLASDKQKLILTLLDYYTEKEVRDKLSDCIYNSVDYIERDINIAEKLVEVVEDLIKETVGNDGVQFEFDKISSPREYNYYNDHIIVDATFTADFLNTLINQIYENKEKFDNWVYDNFTSYSGFISFYPNSFKEWEKEGYLDINEMLKERFNAFVITLLLNFIVKYKNDSWVEILYNETLEESYLENYMNSNEFIKCLEKEVEEITESKSLNENYLNMSVLPKSDVWEVFIKITDYERDNENMVYYENFYVDFGKKVNIRDIADIIEKLSEKKFDYIEGSIEIMIDDKGYIWNYSIETIDTNRNSIDYDIYFIHPETTERDKKFYIRKYEEHKVNILDTVPQNIKYLF